MTRSEAGTPWRLFQLGGLLAVSALVALGLVSAIASHRASGAPALAPKAPEGLSGQAIEPPLALPHATLEDTSGQLFTLRPGPQPLLLLYFGSSRCLDACSETLAALANARDLLSPSQRTSLAVVVVTTDPEYDTPAVMRKWLDNFDPTFAGLTGYRAVIEELRSALRLGGISARESGSVLLFHDGEAHRSYQPNTTAATFAHDLAALLATH